MKFDGTDTYPVGVLHTLQRVYRALTVPELAGKRYELSRRFVRQEAGYIRRQAKAGNWRAVRNSFNGYLSEHDGHPHNCGTGWTKRAAERRAERLCQESH